MPGKVFPRDALPFVEVISRLTATNPFAPERIALEKKALGDEYQEIARPWNVEHWEREEDPNLVLLNRRVVETAEACRAELARGAPLAEREVQLYRNLVYYITYYRVRGDFDQLVKRTHQRGGSLERVRFYDRFKRDLDYFFAPGETAVPMEYSYAHIFSLFYQLRRAFYHIFAFIIGASPAATRLRARVWQSTFTHDMGRYWRSLHRGMGDIITLITGPSGSGKELVARAIGLSRYIPFEEDRREFAEDFLGAFYPLNLASLSPTLIESELFGHRKGAFTGALQDHKGYFETCGPHGTVFLDEIGEVEPSIQVKLLRVLQTRQFQRLGDPGLRPFGGKVMAATNRELSVEMAEGRFREDFYYRLCSDRIDTPALVDVLDGSLDELRYLVEYVAVKLVGEGEAEVFTDECCQAIESKLGANYPWPGNFRELEQCVRNILVHGEYTPEAAGAFGDAPALGDRMEAGDLTAAEMMSLYVTRIYARIRNYEETARRLGLDRRTVKKHIDADLLDELTG